MAEARKGTPPERPWQQRKRGETVEAYQARTNHSCYACGVYIADLAALDKHEETHR